MCKAQLMAQHRFNLWNDFPWATEILASHLLFFCILHRGTPQFGEIFCLWLLQRTAAGFLYDGKGCQEKGCLDLHRHSTELIPVTPSLPDRYRATWNYFVLQARENYQHKKTSVERQPSALLGIRSSRLTWQMHLPAVGICSTKDFKCALRKCPFHVSFWMQTAGYKLLGYHLLMAAMIRVREQERDQLKVREGETWISQEYKPSLHLENCCFHIMYQFSLPLCIGVGLWKEAK